MEGEEREWDCDHGIWEREVICSALTSVDNCVVRLFTWLRRSCKSCPTEASGLAVKERL